MKAVILCAGYATRLYPLTLNTPKALLHVGDKPLLSHIIQNLSSIKDLDKINIVSNDKFYNHFLEWAKKEDKRIEVINDNTKTNEERLGGVGDLALALNRIEDDDIMVLFGDLYFNFSLSNFVDNFNKKNEITMALHDLKDIEKAKRFGVLETKSGKVIGFEEKPANPKSSLINAGVYIFPKTSVKDIKDYMASDKNKENIGYIIIDFIKNKKDIRGFVFDDEWVDIGTLEDYKKLNEKIKLARK
jgi:glucose-1-phosphate thymidylyltransferase